MLTYFLIGAAIGAVTGVPIGPVNVAVIDSAYRHNLRRAIAVGFGGAVADSLYAGLGILGIGPILERYPHIPPILFGVSGLVLVVYGLLTIRSQPVEPKVAAVDDSGGPQKSHMASGFFLGVALIVMNPAAIVTWVVIVGSFMSGVGHVDGLAASAGVGVGSFAWFTFVAYLADHGKRLLGAKAIWITRVVGILLVGYGLYSLVRAGLYLFTKVL